MGIQCVKVNANPSNLILSSSFPTVGAAPSLAGQSFSATAESSSSSTQSSSSTSSSSSSSASATASKGSSSIGVGGGVGIGIGVAAAAAFAAFVYWYRKRGRKEEDQGREKYGGTSYTTSPPPPSGTFTRPSPQLAGQFNRSEGGMTIPYSPSEPPFSLLALSPFPTLRDWGGGGHQ